MPQKKKKPARAPKPSGQACAFCRNKRREFMIAGVSAYICDLCIGAFAILVSDHYRGRGASKAAQAAEVAR